MYRGSVRKKALCAVDGITVFAWDFSKCIGYGLYVPFCTLGTYFLEKAPNRKSDEEP